MKHIFIVNPCAGGHDNGDEIAAALDILDADATVYETTGPRDATRFVDDWCATHAGETARFYACGGDGTLNEVVSGAVGHANAEVTCYPCGSGNDFVRYFPEADFHDLEALLSASAREVDVFRIDGVDGYDCRYALNTLNFGFEAAVCHTMAEVRRMPLIGGPMAYTTGIVHSLFHGRRHSCRVTVDGERWFEGDLLLLSMANGQWAGGGFHCAPRAVADDGLIEVMMVTPMSIAHFAKLIKYYKNGQLLDREELRQIVTYRRGHSVAIEAFDRSPLAADGEVMAGSHFDVQCLHKALKFAVPQENH